jgi:uncharacterized protein YqgV (UPF0045/DUF77 family)
MSVVAVSIKIGQRKEKIMTLNEMKLRYKELMRIAESETMTAGEFDELMALYKKINNL